MDNASDAKILQCEEDEEKIKKSDTYIIKEKMERKENEDEIFIVKEDHDESTFIRFVHRDFEEAVFAALKYTKEDYGNVSITIWKDGEKVDYIWIGGTW